ncbi:type 2 isopentenyl-diphosphate Delta-isomerase [candidate division WWE3 bacterium]|uniref:Isopentenyl-diphosphate delta-isomerase n=1 Tax=candidate division WWE3 bacterium TaxID=2053526 RepID=A0A3A4ZCM0_UNCKA|nr:MAG: type 2 isopentenyl-diphosphate Delta-isomerase [candidate division WWE3 bacterium]
MSEIENRKIQHINLAKDPQSQIGKEPFENVKLDYKALPELDLSSVDTSTNLLTQKITQPLIIASMTGGTSHAGKINTNLAIGVEETGIAMGVGSQRIALELEDARNSFKLVRKHAPNAVIFANMGAIQLNYGKSIDDYKAVVEMVEANALYLHLNPLQEAIQPEGDTNFQGLLDKIENLVKEIGVPVFVKEVGHGIDKESISKLVEIGIFAIDVAGANGTSWAWIEAQRRNSPNLSEWFKSFGISTEESLAYACEYKDKIKIVASGGIRSPVHGLKARVLGADYYSAALPFLEPALDSPETVINTIKEWEKGLKTAMFATGRKSW